MNDVQGLRGRLWSDEPSKIGLRVDLSEMSWDTRRSGETDIELTLFGPLGVPAMNVTLEELGLSVEEQQWVIAGLTFAPETDAWVSDDVSRWHKGSIPADQIYSMVNRPDGSLVAIATGGADLPAIMLSADGIAWEPVDVETTPAVAQRWRELIVGRTDHSPGALLLSEDGLTWDRVDITDRFPMPIEWRGTARGAGSEGLAMTMEGRESGRRIRQTDVPTLRGEDGSVLSLDFRDGVVDLETNDTSYSYELNRGGVELPDGIGIDLERQVMMFGDPESGEVLAEHTFDELQRSERQYFASSFAQVQHQALVFTENGSEWTIQDLAAELGSDSRVAHLEVGAGHVTAIVRNRTEVLDLNPHSGFEIWSAEIP